MLRPSLEPLSWLKVFTRIVFAILATILVATFVASVLVKSAIAQPTNDELDSTNEAETGPETRAPAVSDVAFPSDSMTHSMSAQLASALSSIDHMSASFTQQTVDRTLRILQENTGELWVNPGAKFRIETHAPGEQVLVSNGQDFWVYDADLEQVIISQLEADVSQVPVLLLGGNLDALDAAYAVSYYEDELGQNYVLTPLSSESLFTSLSVSFDHALPVRIAILDALGQRTLISLTDVNVDPHMEPSVFTFLPPAGTDVIDDRS